MPRKARIDAPGALQHIIVRGIEKKPIFRNDIDRNDFIRRLGQLIHDTQTACYAWALMDNHVHLLLRTGQSPLSTVMRRLLTGYAIGFNRRHHRHGHLFQNRYKSILCEEDAYLKQLVGYIHLNPFRAGIVETVKALQTYPFTGHGALLGKKSISWQDTDYILSVFGKTERTARNNYSAYVAKCAKEGKRPELAGGGLIRSAGGWQAVKEAYREGIRLTSDERILGSSDFVERVLVEAGETYERRMRLKVSGIDLDRVVEVVCADRDLDSKDLATTSRKQPVSEARALISYIAVRELNMPGAQVARNMNVDRSSISRAILKVHKDPGLRKNARRLVSLLEISG